jgi:N-methylhydantoinase A
MGIKVAIDTGGTFTDAVTIDEKGKVGLFKAFTTPHDYLEGVTAVLKKAADFYELSIDRFLELCSTFRGGAIGHGSTISTNAVIEKKFPKTGLICTKGHRDILLWREGGELTKKNPSVIEEDYPEPFIRRYLTGEVSERINSEGGIEIKLNENEVRKVIRQFKKYDVKTIAVSLLWSFVNPDHENRIGKIIEEEYPEVDYCLSHLVNPIIREYRRTITTAMNAAIMPLIRKYITEFETSLGQLGYKGNLSLFTASGGIVSSKEMAKLPIYSIGSGPSLAPTAALEYGMLEAKTGNIVCIDMGGTSTDISIITNGQIPILQEGKVDCELLGIAMVDIDSIGSGGGSIATVDAGGLIHVGPMSAGSVPGPACYMKGGKDATVSDANLLLGYLDPDYFVGGEVKLSKKASENAIQTNVAKLLNLGLQDAAFSIWATVNSNMVQGIRNVASRKGLNLEKYALICGGGAAGTHIVSLAKSLGISKVIVPKAAGTFSAMGGVLGSLVKEFSTTFKTDSLDFNYEKINETLINIEKRVSIFFEKNGVPPERQDPQYAVLARYAGQLWEIPVPLRSKIFKNKTDVENLVEDFHKTHFELFAVNEPEQYVEFLLWRALAIGKQAPIKFAEITKGDEASITLAPRNKRNAYFAEYSGVVETKIYSGNLLRAENVIIGPAIIEEITTTIVIPPGYKAVVSKWGNLIVTFNQ